MWLTGPVVPIPAATLHAGRLSHRTMGLPRSVQRSECKGPQRYLQEDGGEAGTPMSRAHLAGSAPSWLLQLPLILVLKCVGTTAGVEGGERWLRAHSPMQLFLGSWNPWCSVEQLSETESAGLWVSAENRRLWTAD